MDEGEDLGNGEGAEHEGGGEGGEVDGLEGEGVGREGPPIDGGDRAEVLQEAQAALAGSGVVVPLDELSVAVALVDLDPDEGIGHL